MLESLVEIDPVAIIVIGFAPVAQLVYLIAVEIEHSIYVAVLLGYVVDPGFIARIDNIDAALERRSQLVAILTHMAGILEEIPLLLHAIFGGIGKGTVSQVVEQRLHAILMRFFDISLYRLLVAVAVDDVGPHLHRCRRRTGQGFVVLVVPVLELHVVDVMAIEVGHDVGYILVGHVAIGREETVAREPVGGRRYIDGNAAIDGLYPVGILAVQVDHIALIVGGRRLPAPAAATQRSLLEGGTQMTVTYHHVGSPLNELVEREIHSLARSIAGFIGIELYLHVTIAIGDGIVLYVKAVAGRNRHENRNGKAG